MALTDQELADFEEALALPCSSASRQERLGGTVYYCEEWACGIKTRIAVGSEARLFPPGEPNQSAAYRPFLEGAYRAALLHLAGHRDGRARPPA